MIVPLRGAGWLGPLMALGGVLWMVYGVGEMIEPWGVAKVYYPDLGYELVTNQSLFLAYSFPGSVALLCTGLGLGGVIARHDLRVGQLGRSSRLLARLAAALGIFSGVSAALYFVPGFFASIVFGGLILGIASFLAGLAAHRAGVGRQWGTLLMAIGVAGIFLLPLRPLVFAFAFLSGGAGALVIGLFGLGWLVAGLRLWIERRTAS